MSRIPTVLMANMQAAPISQGRPGLGSTAVRPSRPSKPGAKPGLTYNQLHGNDNPMLRGQHVPYGGRSLSRGTPLQTGLGATDSAPTNAQTGQPANQPAPTGTGGIFGNSAANPVAFINSLLGGMPSNGLSFNFGAGQQGSATYQPPSPQQRAMAYLGGGGAVSTSNPVTPGSWWAGGAGSPTQVGQLGAWQNQQNIGQTAQAFGARDGMLQNDMYGGTPTSSDYTDGGFGKAMQYLGGGGAVSTSNPVTPGSWWNGGIGSPSAAGALGAWQNQQNIAQTAQAFGGGRGPQMANSDYAPGGAMYRAPASSPAPQAAASVGGSPSGTAGGGLNLGGLTQPMGGAAGGQGIAPIFSTIDGQRQIFDQGQTQRNVNSQVADIKTAGNLRGNMKHLGRPGMSLDAGSMAAAAPIAGQSAADAAAVQASGPLQDQLANSLYQLSGQEAQGQETLSMASLLRRLQQAGDYQQSAYTSSVLGPIVQMLMSGLSA